MTQLCAYYTSVLCALMLTLKVKICIDKTMNFNKHYHILFIVLLLNVTMGSGQTSMNTLGGDATGIGGNIAYSIGQVVYTTNSSNSGSKSQGIQQAYEILTLNVMEMASDISLLVYPNPTTDDLTLQIGDDIIEKLSYQLFDLQGKLLKKGEVNTHQTQINTSELFSGVYLINVINQKTKNIQTFRIIKK